VKELNIFLEGFSGKTLNSLYLQYDEIVQDNIFTIVLDTPGLLSSQKIDIFSEKKRKQQNLLQKLEIQSNSHYFKIKKEI